MGQPHRRRQGEDNGRDQPRHRAQPEQHQGRDQVNKGRQRLHQVQRRADQPEQPRPVRGGDAQRDADGAGHQGGRQHQGQRFHGFLPVALVQDEQQRQGDEQAELPRPAHQVGQPGHQQDQHRTWHPHQRRRNPVDHEAHGVRHAVKEPGAMRLQHVYPRGNHRSDRDLVVRHPVIEQCHDGPPAPGAGLYVALWSSDIKQSFNVRGSSFFRPQAIQRWTRRSPALQDACIVSARLRMRYAESAGVGFRAPERSGHSARGRRPTPPLGERSARKPRLMAYAITLSNGHLYPSCGTRSNAARQQLPATSRTTSALRLRNGCLPCWRTGPVYRNLGS